MTLYLEAVVFDLDGTLVDSVPDIAAALNGTLVAAGHRALSLETVVSMVGGGADLLVARALAACGEAPAPSRIELVLEDFLARYSAEPCLRTTLYPGAAELVGELAAHGMKLGVCTNKPAAVTDLVLTGLGIRGIFGSVIAATTAMPLKPRPDMLLAVLADLQVSAAHALMVGDSAADVGVAHAAGVRSALLAHGYNGHSPEDLGADVVLDGFAGLGRYIRERLRQETAM